MFSTRAKMAPLSTIKFREFPLSLRGEAEHRLRPDEMTEPPIWNPAVMLKQLGVDPGVLGWNDELEDWD